MKISIMKNLGRYFYCSQVLFCNRN